MLRLLRELQREEGAAVLFITHNLGLVAKLCDRVSVLHAGRIVEHGEVRSTFEAPQVALYAGTVRGPRHATTGRPRRCCRSTLPVTDAMLAEAEAYDRLWWATDAAAGGTKRA